MDHAEIGHNGRPVPRIAGDIEGFCIQASVLVAAENHYDRLRRVHLALQDSPAMADVIRLYPPPTFNDFLDLLIVRGVVQIAPTLVELERAVGLVETLGADEMALLRKTLADDLTRTADALTALQTGQPDRAMGDSAVGALRDAAAILRLAAMKD